MNRVVHFEIHAANPERAARFYSDVFGWNINEWLIPGVQLPDENRYWLVSTGDQKTPGIDGGLLFRRGQAPSEGQPVNAYVCTMSVDSVDASVTKVQAVGGTIALAKMPIKGVGWIAYGKDTEGNIFGMMQEDKNAG
jgi:uncharacterized protein